MNPQCARCGKVVYPTEKVNCLDKVLGRGRAGTAPAGRARPPRAPLPPAPAGRAGPGRAGGGAGRAGRWQTQRLRGLPLRRHPRCHRRATTAVSPRWRRASGGRGGPESPCGDGGPAVGVPPGSLRGEVAGGPRPAVVVGASPSWGGFGCPARHGGRAAGWPQPRPSGVSPGDAGYRRAPSLHE